MRSVLRNSTFRRLFVGRLVTNAGDSLYYVAAMWLVFDLGGSSFYTGLAGALTLAPQTLQFLTGPLVDRWQIRRILVGTQLAQGVLVLAIPVAHATGHLTVGLVLVLMPVLSMLNQFVYPAQSAALPRIVEDDELVDANSLFSFAYQGVDAAFNALGGILIAVVGAVSMYLVDAVTFAAAVLLFASVRIPPATRPTDDSASGDAVAATDGGEASSSSSFLASYTVQLREGVGYIRGTILALTLIGSVVVNGLIGATMAVLPAFAELRGGSETYGLLLAAITTGILLGALAAGPMKRYSLSSLSIVGFGIGGALWLAAVAVGWLPATAALFCLAWIPVGVTNVVFAAMVQTVVPDDLLGRVTSVAASGSSAAMPVGSLLGGVAADAWAPAPVVAATGVGFVVVTAGWALHPTLRNLPPVEELDPAEYGLTRETN